MSHASVLVVVKPGQDVEAAVAEQMAPFDENGKWFGEGSRWDWYQIGGRFSGKFGGKDIIRVGDLDLIALWNQYDRECREAYAKAAADTSGIQELIYGVDPNATSLDDYLKKILGTNKDDFFPASYAFLHNKEWHERERIGWFGTPAKTECEIAADEKGEQFKDRCVFKNDDAGSKIVSWNDDPRWQERFYGRFIRPLDPDMILVNVDYHV